ncbi:MAG TPA: peptide chain release factor N(5)-glutamine methyltransferase [Bacteroidales bacterium]
MDIRNNSLIYLREKYINDLSVIFSNKEARQMLNVLIQHFFGISRTTLALNPNLRLSESEILNLHFAVKGLKKHKPLQYITGKSEFFGFELLVNESVLIPRPETEELVQLIVSKEKQKNTQLLDVGTGSGCIAIALEKLMPEPGVSAIDIDEKTLKIATANASQNSSSVNFIQLDILDENSWKKLGIFDVIVSNPPYVTISDKNKMQENVLNYEPHLALFVPENDELIFYRKICQFAKTHLAKKGRIYFEINENKGFEINKLLKEEGFQLVEIHRDFRGKMRFATALKP